MLKRPKLKYGKLSCQKCGSDNIVRDRKTVVASCGDCGQTPVEGDCAGKIPQEAVDIVKDMK